MTTLVSCQTTVHKVSSQRIQKIKKDKYIIYGEDEIKYITNLKYKKQFLDKNLKEIKIISSASHIYQGKEKVLAEYILDIIKRKE